MKTLLLVIIIIFPMSSNAIELYQIGEDALRVGNKIVRTGKTTFYLEAIERAGARATAARMLRIGGNPYVMTASVVLPYAWDYYYEHGGREQICNVFGLMCDQPSSGNPGVGNCVQIFDSCYYETSMLRTSEIDTNNGHQYDNFDALISQHNSQHPSDQNNFQKVNNYWYERNYWYNNGRHYEVIKLIDIVGYIATNSRHTVNAHLMSLNQDSVTSIYPSKYNDLTNEQKTQFQNAIQDLADQHPSVVRQTVLSDPNILNTSNYQITNNDIDNYFDNHPEYNDIDYNNIGPQPEEDDLEQPDDVQLPTEVPGDIRHIDFNPILNSLNGLSSRFPFAVINYLGDCFNGLCVEPATPQFNLPLGFTTMHIDLSLYNDFASLFRNIISIGLFAGFFTAILWRIL